MKPTVEKGTADEPSPATTTTKPDDTPHRVRGDHHPDVEPGVRGARSGVVVKL